MSSTSPPTAVVFDLDGVITFTASLHFAAWKALFDDFLRTRARREDRPFRPFTESDYRAYVDGRPRHDGVRAFLDCRDIDLPEGDPADPQDRASVRGLGHRKNQIFLELLQEKGVEVDPDAAGLLGSLAEADIRIGVASSSENAEGILKAAEIDDLFDARVDGVVSERLGLRGKPAPDIFLQCLDRLDRPDPASAVVVEDAVVGVEAGRAGGFGLVIGVDRLDRSDELREHGADWIVEDLQAVTVDRLRAWFDGVGVESEEGRRK